MQKKVLVLALGAVLASSAAYAKDDGWDGPNSVVSMYGRAYPEIVVPSGTGATSAGTQIATITNGTPSGESGIIRRTEMSSSNSRLGFRGYEKLARDLKVVWQLETEFHLDSNDSAFAQRDSFVGLSHRYWGDIKLGRMDTPFKTYGDDISFLGVGSGNFVSSSNVLRKTGFGDNSASSFHLRRTNVVQYDTPEWGGLHGTIQYSTNEADTNGNNKRRPHVWSGAVAWEGGPFEVSLAHEIHWDLFGGSRNVPGSQSNFSDTNVRSKDKATQGMVKWKLNKAHQFEADFIRKEYDENASVAGRFKNYKNNAWQLIWDARWTPQWRTALEYIHSDKGSCARVNAACNTDGLEGTQVQAGVAYYFSRQTYLFAMYALLRNGFSAQYNNLDLQAPEIGEDIKQWAVGLSHSF
jgi:predicted porin